MNAARLLPRIAPAFILILALAWTLPSCAPTSIPTLFRPPGGPASPTPPLPDPQPAAPTPTFFPTETLVPAPTEIIPCTNALKWLNDLTYDDNSTVLPGQLLDKQWLAQNSGTCDWDARYKLRNINGETLGAPAKIPLYPARAGAQVILRIVFTAPAATGTFRSEWQAEGPDGASFGDTVYIQIIVSP